MESHIQKIVHFKMHLTSPPTRNWKWKLSGVEGEVLMLSSGKWDVGVVLGHRSNQKQKQILSLEPGYIFLTKTKVSPMAVVAFVY